MAGAAARGPRLRRPAPDPQRLLLAPGRGVRLLRRGDPDRDRLREGDARRRQLRATARCSPRWGVGMVVGSLVFAAARSTSLKLLLFWSTIASARPISGWRRPRPCSLACVAASLGGLGNGVQWVSVMSAIQGLTAEQYQARVVGAARVERLRDARHRLHARRRGRLPVDPRATFVVAGVGVLVVVAIAAPLLRRTDWPAAGERREDPLAAAAESPLAGQAVRPQAAPDVGGQLSGDASDRAAPSPLRRRASSRAGALRPLARDARAALQDAPARRSRPTSSWVPPARSIWFPERTYGGRDLRARRAATGGGLRAVRLRLLHPLGRLARSPATSSCRPTTRTRPRRATRTGSSTSTTR